MSPFYFTVYIIRSKERWVTNPYFHVDTYSIKEQMRVNIK